MKKIFILIFLNFIGFAICQNHFIGIYSGLNWSNGKTEDFFDNTKFMTSFSGGLIYEYTLSNNFYLASGLNYQQRGFFLDEYVVDNTRSYYKYNYISFPIEFGIMKITNILIFGKLGFITSYLTSAETRFPFFDQNRGIFRQKTQSFSDRVTKWDFGGKISAGAGYRIYNRYIIFVSFSYYRSLTSVTNSNYIKWKIWHKNINLSIGIKYNFEF